MRCASWPTEPPRHRVTQPPEPVSLRLPEVEGVPLVVSVPHAGTWVDPAVAENFASPAMATLPMTDWHVHRLYDFVPGLGGALLWSPVSRVMADLNRAPRPRALYPGRFETSLVPTETFQGEAIWQAAPAPRDVERRRKAWHEPYHEALAEALTLTIRAFGGVVLIDCHSVASVPNRLHGALKDEIYLGNRDGAACPPALLDYVAEGFREAGLRVAVNAPYKGGYITDYYGRWPGVQALQIEMCQRVYMDEDDPPGGPSHPRFDETRRKLRTLFEGLVARLPELVSRPA